MTPVLISLCDHSGEWPRPYREAGFEVVQVDLKHRGDARLIALEELPVFGVLAAPPCTVFSLAGNRWPRSDDDMREGLSVVDACVRIAWAYQRKAQREGRRFFWALENPVGKLSNYLGPALHTFDPCDYGDPYTKATALWGDFNARLPRTPVEPVEGSKMWALCGGKSERTKAARSITPSGFARAFCAANPGPALQLGLLGTGTDNRHYENGEGNTDGWRGG